MGVFLFLPKSFVIFDVLPLKMTERERQLMYCKVCTKSSKNLQKGIICSLTNKIANFKNTCPSYEENQELTHHEIRSLSAKINQQYDYDTEDLRPQNGAFNTYLFHDLLKSKHHFTTQKDTHRLKILRSAHRSKKAILFFSFFALLSTGFLFEANYKAFMAAFVVCLLGILFSYLVLKITDADVVLRFYPKGFAYLDQEFEWNEVLVYKLVRIVENKVSRKQLIVGTKSRGIHMIEISYANIRLKDLARIIELNTTVA
jgi:hypothetical protein